MFALALLSAAAFPPATQYTWRGHKCSYVKAGQGPPVLLLHGFAGSAFNCWRSTVPALAATHTVYGLDLLGLGASAQPANVEYSIDLWREQCADFLREHTWVPDLKAWQLPSAEVLDPLKLLSDVATQDIGCLRVCRSLG